MVGLEANRESIEAKKGFGGETNVPTIAVCVFHRIPMNVKILVEKMVIDVVGLCVTPITL